MGYTTANEGIFGEQIYIPLKDFAPVGLVFSESSRVIDSPNSSTGDIFTYEALLKEAGRLQADAIINVVIDRRFENLTNTHRQETWYGSALAIRYTGIINGEEYHLNKARSFTAGGVSAVGSGKDISGAGSSNDVSGVGTSKIGDVMIENEGIFGEQIYIPVKNFEAAGLVFTDARYSIDVINSTIVGDTFTYQALLKEAAKLGAHAIINIAIDRGVENLTIDEHSTRNETWYASALAIKYTDSLKKDVSLNEPRSFTTGGGATF
jgi:uncharacterized protein YbjQ (UPF0145 family)